jgi:hypothetical protein
MHARSTSRTAAVTVGACTLLVAAVLAAVPAAASRWSARDLDGPDVAGANGRTADAVDTTGTAAVEFAGAPHVFHGVAGDLRHAWFSGAAWRFETLDGAGGPGGRTTNDVASSPAALLFAGAPHVFSVDTTAGRLRHGWWTGAAWRFESLDGPGVAGVGGRSAVRVVGDVAVVLHGGTPHAWYRAGDDLRLRHAWWTGTRWRFETLDTAVGRGIAVVHFAGAPHVFTRSNATGRLRQVWWDGAAGRWRTQDLDGPGTTGAGRSATPTGHDPTAVVFAGGPHVFVRDDAGNLRQAWWTGARWAFATLQGPATCGDCAPGTAARAALFGGVPHVWHHDTSTGALRHSWWSGVAWAHEVLDGGGDAQAAAVSDGARTGLIGMSAAVVVSGGVPHHFSVDSTTGRLRLQRYGPRPVPPVHGPVARHDIGTPAFTDVWVDAATGSDDGDGSSPQRAFATLRAAWYAGATQQRLSSSALRLRVAPGTYAGGWFENRRGTAARPLMITAADPGRPPLFTGQLAFHGVDHLYLDRIRVQVEGGHAVHVARSRNVLVRNSEIRGRLRDAHDETLKVNQSQYVWVEDNVLRGAGDNAVDFVAVQWGHVVGNDIGDAGGWCAYAKGGSAHVRFDGNLASRCGAGITVGTGTGLEYMVEPWVHYEAYDVAITNNVITDTWGAGLGVAGGYDVLVAHNTLVRVGSRSHVIEAVHSGGGCNGDTARCAYLQSRGSWGTTAPEADWVPNRHVQIVNNLIVNPPSAPSRWQQLWVRGPTSPPVGSPAPNPSRADDDLRIAGNVVWNGGAALPLGIEHDGAGCRPTNPTCNAAQLRADNVWNGVAGAPPQFVDADGGDLRPLPGSATDALVGVDVRAVSWADVPAGVPAPTTSHGPVTLTRNGVVRTGNRPGAY